MYADSETQVRDARRHAPRALTMVGLIVLLVGALTISMVHRGDNELETTKNTHKQQFETHVTSDAVVCPTGWTVRNGKCYKFDGCSDFPNAVAKCGALGANLATLDANPTADDYAFLKSLVSSYSGCSRQNEVFLGYKRIGNTQNFERISDNKDETAFLSTLWAPGQPNNAHGENAVGIYSDEKVHDFWTTDKLGVVCEKAGSGPPQSSLVELIGSYANMKSKLSEYGCGGIGLTDGKDSGRVYWATQGCVVSDSEIVFRTGVYHNPNGGSVFTVTIKNDNTMTCGWRFYNFNTKEMSHYYDGYVMKHVCFVDKMYLFVKPLVGNTAHPVPSNADAVQLVGRNKVCPGYIIESTDGKSQIMFNTNKFCLGFGTTFIGQAQMYLTDGSIVFLQLFTGWNIPTGHCLMAQHRLNGTTAGTTVANHGGNWDLSFLAPGSFKCDKQYIRFVY